MVFVLFHRKTGTPGRTRECWGLDSGLTTPLVWHGPQQVLLKNPLSFAVSLLFGNIWKLPRDVTSQGITADGQGLGGPAGSTVHSRA